MKKTNIIICCVLLLFVKPVLGQETDENTEDEPKTILSDDVSVTGFGGIFMTLTKMDNSAIHMIGGGGAMIFAKKIFFGGYGLGMTTNFEASKGKFKEKEMDFGHGGFWVGYIFKNKSVFHPVVSILCGWGNISARNATGYLDRETYDNFFTLSPVFELEISIAKFFRIGTGATYHYYSGVDFSEYTDNDFSGPGAYLSLKFGEF